MSGKSFDDLKVWNRISIFILFAIGSIFHFLYELSGESPIVGAIAAVNESIWEHQKMVLLPLIGWWAIFYFLKRSIWQIDRQEWFTGLTVSLVTSAMTIPIAYYFYTQAFGIHLIVIDALILLLAFATGQLLGFHVYRYSKGLPFLVSLTIILMVVLLFAAFTFNPPHIPWFRDGPTGGYGIL